jgi:drug/metabolite transporter (DMT)-like permease
MISLKHLSEDNTHSLALAALLVGGLVMGFSPVFVREAEVGAFASAFWRVLFALPLLYVWARIEKRQDPTSKSFAITPSLLLAGVMFSGDLIFWHLAILNTTMANATFMVCLSPVWVAVFSGIFLNEPINKQAWLGLAICLIGLAMLINSSLTIDPSRLIGDIYGLITSFFLGFYFLAMRRGRRNLKSGALFFGSTVITTIVLLIAALAAGDRLIPDTSSG